MSMDKIDTKDESLKQLSYHRHYYIKYTNDGSAYAAPNVIIKFVN